jgi:transketolase
MIKNILNAQSIRLTILDILKSSKASHLGSNMSVVEIIMAIYSSLDHNLIKNKDPLRDRVFISKGHCAAATFSVLHHLGIIDEEIIKNYHLDNSFLAGHVSHSVHGVEHSTGALGHGISVAVGAALGLRNQNQQQMVFALCGDGELQEGSVWEALLFCGHHKLNNLIIFIDYNKIGNINFIDNVVSLEPIKKKFESFNLNTKIIDGHNFEQIKQEIQIAKTQDKTTILVCNTIKGKDIFFAENKAIWAYKILDQDHYEKAVKFLKTK